VSELESLTHLTSTLFVARFPEDIDPGSALDPGNWSIIGNDSTPLPIDNILPAYPPFSWRDFFVQTRRPTDQEYSLTVSGLTGPEGNPLDPFTHSWIPLQPPTEYLTDGIMNPSLDGRYYGSRVEIAIFRYPEWVTNVLGIDSDQNEYPFTQDPNDSRYWSFDTSQLPGPDEGFRVQPVPAEGHEEDFTGDELAIITIPLLPSPFPPWMREVMISNQTRPGASTFYPTDTIVPTAFVHADRIRGAKVMIARIPFDPSILLPYYPPGANDPNDPNYDPEAPEDGSGNPDWWSLPPRPDFPYYPWSPDAPPPWMPRPMSAAASPWEDQVLPAYPPDIGKDEMWQIELPSFKPIDHDLGPGSYDLIVEVYDHENKKSDYILPFIIDYPAIIDWFRYYGEDITIRDVQDPNIIGWKLKHDGSEWDFTEDPENPGTWKIPSTVLPAPLPDDPRLPHIMPAYPPDFGGDMLPEVEIGVHALLEDSIRIWGAQLMNLSSAFHSAVWSPHDNTQVDVNVDSPATFSGVDIYLRRLLDNQDFYLGEIGASGTGRNRFSGTFDLGESQSFSGLLDLSNPEAPPEQSFDLYAAAFLGSSANKVTTSSRKAGEGKANRYSYLESHWADGADAPGDPTRKYFGVTKTWLRDSKGDWENKYNDKIHKHSKNYDGSKSVDPVVLKALLATESGLNQDKHRNIGQLGKGGFYDGWNEWVVPEDRISEPWGSWKNTPASDEAIENPDKNIRAASGYLYKAYKMADNNVPEGTSEKEKYKLAVMGYHLGVTDFGKVIDGVEQKGQELTYDTAKEVMRELANEDDKKDRLALSDTKARANEHADDVEQQVARIYDEERDPKEDVDPDGMIEFDNSEAHIEGPEREPEGATESE